MEIPFSDCLIQKNYRPDHTQELNLRLVCVRFQGQRKVFLSALRLSRVGYHSTIPARSAVGTMTTSEAAVGTMTTSEAAVPRQSH